MAGITTGRFEGGTDDPGEKVVVVVDRNAAGDFVVRRWRVNQGQECGITRFNHRTDPDIMPRRIIDDRFVINDRIFGVSVFRAVGSFTTTAGDVISGRYRQAACDGDSDTYVVFED